MTNGLPPSQAEQALTKDGKDAKDVERLKELDSLIRRLTVVAYQNDPHEYIRSSFDQPQSATTDDEIMKLALDVNSSLRNEQDWTNSILFPRGRGDDIAVTVLAQAFRIPKFAIVRPVVSNGDRMLEATDSLSPVMAENLVMIHNGHFEAIASNDVSLEINDGRLLYIGFPRTCTSVIWKHMTTNSRKRFPF